MIYLKELNLKQNRFYILWFHCKALYTSKPGSQEKQIAFTLSNGNHGHNNMPQNHSFIYVSAHKKCWFCPSIKRTVFRCISSKDFQTK